MKIFHFLFLIAILISFWSCQNESNAICDKIYEDCSGALVDEQGRSISALSCVSYFEEKEKDEPGLFNVFSDCIQNSSCEELSSCFNLKTSE